VPLADGAGWITLVRVSYTEGEEETYVLPLAFAAGERAGRVRLDHAPALIAELEAGGVPGLLYGAEGDPELASALLDAIGAGRRFPGAEGVVVASATGAFASRRATAAGRGPRLLSGEQSNTSIRYGDAFMMKLFRKVEPGINPDLEVGVFLTERAAFPHTPPVCGALEYVPRRGPATALAILQGFVPNEGDAWRFTLDAVGLFFEGLAGRPEWRRPAPPPRGLLDAATAPPPPDASLAGAYLEAAALLGRRTAELHRALASDAEDPAFAPEPFTRLDQRALYQSQRNLTEDSFALLRRRLPDLPESVRERAERVLGRRDAVLDRFRRLLDRRATILRTRTHGDYHLGQVLWTGRDFVIIDFEGEPARPAAIRRAKRSALRDVASMLRSYHYAAYQGMATFEAKGAVPPGDDLATAESWAVAWHGWVSASSLRAYLDEAREAVFLPREAAELDDLLVGQLLEKAVYELAYELNNRPAWVRLPLQGIAALVGEAD
jgi:trehalose synthase-fused probable maltokinase